jgi:putative heme iron utilization protein
MSLPPSPLLRPTDDEARALARGLLARARFAALGTIDPETGLPLVTRVGFGLSGAGEPLSLVSTLALHSTALARRPEASLLVGEPGPRGDPLTHPRLTLQARARFVAPGEAGHPELAGLWLATHPKARLYLGFADFRFVLFTPLRAWLNGGFGKAFSLTPDDLAP